MQNLLVIVLWIAFGMLGRMIGKRKGRAMEGTYWGFLFGPIGLLIITLRGRDEAALTRERDGGLPRSFE